MTEHPPPTLYEWLGRDTARFTRLIETFYDFTLQDGLLAPLFTQMPLPPRVSLGSG